MGATHESLLIQMSVIRTVLRARVFLLCKAYGVASQKLSERSKRDEPVLPIYLSHMNTPQRFLTVKTKAIIVQPYLRKRGLTGNSESGTRERHTTQYSCEPASDLGFPSYLIQQVAAIR